MTYHLPRLVGASRAADIIFTGRDVAADEAERIGLASAVLPEESFEAQVAVYAGRLAKASPVSLALTKRLLTQSPDTALEPQLHAELVHIKTCFATPEVQQAIAAFRGKA